MALTHKKSLPAFDTEYLNVITNTFSDENYIKSILPLLNQNLSNATTKENAFDIIVKLIDIFSATIIKDNYNTWMKFALNYHQKEEISDLHFGFIGKLLSLCINNQDFHKIVVANYLSKIVETCLSTSIKSSASLSSLKCLEKCLKIFPKTNIVYKKRIDIFLESCLDVSLNPAILKKAGRCMLLSNQLGGTGVNGSTHIKNFTDYVNKLMKTLHNLYDECFNEIEEFHHYNIEIEQAFVFKEVLHVEENEQIKLMFRRINNVTMFLKATFHGSFPVNKSFNPALVISIIERGLSAHDHFDKDDKRKNIFINSLIEHQIQLLDFLNVFITCLKGNLIRFGTIKILEENLKRSKNCKCFNSTYIMKIYELIQHSILSTNEQIDKTTYEKIIQYILKDISYERTAVTLKIDTNKHKSKKAKNKSVQEKIINSFENSKADVNPKVQETKQKICVSALNALKALLTRVEWNINRRIIDTLYNTIARILLGISVNVIYFPYTNKECRLALYKAFIATFNQNYCLNLNLATNILIFGECSNYKEISNVCAEGLESITKIMQPIIPSLSIPNEEKDDLSELEKEFAPITCSDFMNGGDESQENEVETVNVVEHQNTQEIHIVSNNVDISEENIVAEGIRNNEEIERVNNESNLENIDEAKLNSLISMENNQSKENIHDQFIGVFNKSSNIELNKTKEADEENVNGNVNESLENHTTKAIDLDEIPCKKLKIDAEVDEEMLNSFNDEVIVE